MKCIINRIFLLNIIFICLFTYINVDASTLNFDKDEGIILYGLEEVTKEKGITIPSKYPTSFQIEIDTNSKIEYKNMNQGRDFKVSDTGLVTLTDSSSYYYDTPLKLQIKIVNDQYLTSDDEIINTFVTVKNYATKYAEDVMDEYLKKNITNDMTEYEKLTKIVEFVVQYPYKTGYSSYTSFVINGGGDCWASTSTIVYMCKKVGITASSRAGWFEGGSNHNNAIAIVDGELLVIEAGYNQTKTPRDYSIQKASNNGWEPSSGKLNQYSGFETELVMPSTYGTYGTGTFTTIGERAFTYTQNEVKSITLPNTIETIEKEAFFRCEELEYLYIPASVKEIGKNVFRDPKKLKSIDLDPNNPYFTYENGIIYNKDKTKIVASLPAAIKGNISFLSTVEEIGDFAFAYNRNITGINLNKNIKKIGEDAFLYTEIRNLTIPNTIEEVGNYAFADCRLQTIVINSNKDIPIGAKAFDGNNVARLYISSSIQTSLDGLLDSAKSSYMTVITHKINEEKLIEKGVKYELTQNPVELKDKMLYVTPVSSIVYTGKQITLDYNLHYGSYELIKNKDYTEEYINNINAGTATLTITGIGKYTGTLTKQFTISRKETNTTIKFNNIWYGQDLNPIIKSNIPIKKTYISYYDSNHKYISNIPTDIGTYYASISVTYDNNYETTYDTFKFSIKKGIAVNKSSIAMYKWSTFQLQTTVVGNEKVAYESENPAIATVSSNGLITAKKLGETIINIKTASGKLAKVKVGVYPIKASMVEVSAIGNQVYTGKGIAPNVIVKYNGVVLKLDRDYTLSYGKNRNIGNGTIKIIFKGSYTGTKTITFLIVPRATTITKLENTKAGRGTVYYNEIKEATGYQIAYKVTGTNGWTYLKSTEAAKFIRNLEKGKYTVTVRSYTTVDNKNYYSSWSPTKVLNITK